MSLSREAQVLRDLLLQHPGALGELLLAERRERDAAWDADADDPPCPVTDAARVAGPWDCHDGDLGWSERREFVHGVIVGLVLSRQRLRTLYPTWRARGEGAWVGFVFDLHPTEVEGVAVGSEATAEACRALVDRWLTGEWDELEGLPRRWRVL